MFNKKGVISWTQLLQEIQTIFEEDNINVEQVADLLASYKANPADWRQYVNFEPHRYTRNLVDSGNGKYNLMILCWGEGMGSSIHSHSDCHCFVKILDGALKETQYEWPDAEDSEERPMIEKASNTYLKDGVSYMSDSIGLHRMENPSHTDGTITLHLYIPGYDTCTTFDERTGHKQECKVTFWSKYGRRASIRG